MSKDIYSGQCVSVSIQGVDEVIKALESQYSQKKVTRAERKAMELSGRYVKDHIKHNIVGYKRTGATVRELIAEKPRRRAGQMTAKIGWDGKGTYQRWRLVHLNEWGYMRNGKHINPRGVGAIRKAVEGSLKEAAEMQFRVLKETLG
jgi:hypothetical protein